MTQPASDPTPLSSMRRRIRDKFRAQTTYQSKRIWILPAVQWTIQIDGVLDISNLTISAKHSIAQWTSLVFLISSHEARIPCLGIKFRRVVVLVIGYMVIFRGQEESFTGREWVFLLINPKNQQNRGKWRIIRKFFASSSRVLNRNLSLPSVGQFVFPDYRRNIFGAVSFLKPFDPWTQEIGADRPSLWHSSIIGDADRRKS